jgi:KEOPS complex subunit Cgi121
VTGLRGDAGFDDIVDRVLGLGGDVLLLDPGIVCGRDHVVSAVIHAERAFREGRQRSRGMLTETALYVACDRQIGRALEKVRPVPGGREYVACVFGDVEPDFASLGLIRDDGLCDPSAEKLAALGIVPDPFTAPGDLVLEAVAMVDLLKQ